MRKMKFFKISIAFAFIFGLLFGVTTSQSEANAATTKANVSQHLYKGLKFLKYPQVSGLTSKSAQKKINASLLGAAKKSYKAYLEVKKQEKEAKGDKNCKDFPSSCHYEYQSLYKVKYNTSGKLSILYTDYQYTGGAHGISAVTSYNYSLSSGKQYKISDILKTKSNFAKVQKYAYKYFSSQEPYSYFVNKVSDVPVNKNTQFYFTKGGIYLIFQEYEVGPYAAGNPTIKIPSSLYK